MEFCTVLNGYLAFDMSGIDFFGNELGPAAGGKLSLSPSPLSLFFSHSLFLPQIETDKQYKTILYRKRTDATVNLYYCAVCMHACYMHMQWNASIYILFWLLWWAKWTERTRFSSNTGHNWFVCTILYSLFQQQQQQNTRKVALAHTNKQQQQQQ